MPAHVDPSFDRKARSREAAAARRYGGGSDGWVVPSTERLVEDSEGNLATGPLNAFAESHSSSSFDVTIDTGEALVGGAHLATDETATVTLDANTSGQTIALGWKDSAADTVLLGDPDTSVGDAFDPDDPRIEIWRFDTDGSGVTSATDLRELRRTLTPERIRTPDYKNVPISGSSEKDVSAASFVQSFGVGSQDSAPTGLAWNNDGTKFYISGAANETIYEYSLSSAFDISTASYSQNFSVDTEVQSLAGLAWNGDGTKLYAVDNGTEDLYSYTLSTAFDISTASYSQNLYVGSETISVNSMAWNDDGTKLFITGYDETVYEYAVSTAYDISTASFTQQNGVAGAVVNPYSLAWNSDGTRLYIVGNSDDELHEYEVSTGYDISDLTFLHDRGLSGEDSDPYGLALNSDDSKIYITGNSNESVFEYDFPSAYDAAVDESNAQFVTLNDDTKFRFSSTDADNVSRLLLRVQQDSTGGWSATWASNIEWGSGTPPSLTSSANAVDVFSFRYDPYRDVWYGIEEGFGFA